jgi:hypothetical protein
MTKVIFRKFKNGEVIALFPQEPATRDGWECMSYMHIGQHGSADPSIVNDTKPAMPYEYADLYNELKSIGYDDLKVCKKFNKNDYKIRKERARL